MSSPPLAPLAAALLLLILVADVAQAKRCATGVKPIPCGDYVGVLYAYDGAEPTRVANLSNWHALNVSERRSLALSVCNYGNYRVHDVTIRGITVVPTLVGNVSRLAQVRVTVHNSGNLDVSKRLVIGRVLPEGKRRGRKAHSAPDTAVVGKIVDGFIGQDAHIAIDVTKTGNVHLRPGTRDLWIGKGTLLNEVLNAPTKRGENCAEYVCYEINVADSANVHGDDRKAKVYIRDGQLEDETLDTGCLGRDAYTNITKTNVANVENVAALHVYDGELSDEAVDAGNLLGATVYVNMTNVGNARFVGDFRVLDGELVDEVIDAKHVQNSYINVTLKDVGNVIGTNVYINEGELVDEVIDVGSMFYSDVYVNLTMAGNVWSSGDLHIFEGELVDEVVDTAWVKDTDLKVDMLHVGNARVNGSITIIESELVDEVLDSRTILRGSFHLNLVDVANVRCSPNTTLAITEGELLEAVADISGSVNGARASVRIVGSGQAHLPNSSMTFVNASFAKPPLDIDHKNTGVELTVIPFPHTSCETAS